MNRRDVYTNGPRSFVSKDYNNISISPSRFQAKNQTLSRRRKQMFLRLALAASAALLLFLIIMPSLRLTVFSAFSFGLFSTVNELELETVRYYDLSNSGGTARGWEREERVLMCAPLRDAESHLPMFFSHLHNFTYPHHLIDLAFLVSDSRDNTLGLLSQMLTDLQNDPDPKQPYGEISVIEKDFGQKVNQDVESRHGFAAQASRRKLMAQARNWLLSAALRPTHSWVYWRDVDVETAPFTILEDLMRHNKDVIVPNVWRPLPDWLGGEQPYDLNSWQESETALALADTLDEDAVIVEGYAEYATWRPHLAYLRDPYGDPDMEMEIDGVGGVSILAKAKVFRSGVHFPAFSFEKHAETEGFGKMAKRMQFSVVGLPHYTVWHLYEPSVDDIRHMEEMEQERKTRENEERERAERAKKIKDEFGDTGSQWDKDKSSLAEINKKEEQIRKEHDAAIAAQDKEKDSESSGKPGNDKESAAHREEDNSVQRDNSNSKSKTDTEIDAKADTSDKQERGSKQQNEGSKDHPIKVGKAGKDDNSDSLVNPAEEQHRIAALKETGNSVEELEDETSSKEDVGSSRGDKSQRSAANAEGRSKAPESEREARSVPNKKRLVSDKKALKEP